MKKLVVIATYELVQETYDLSTTSLYIAMGQREMRKVIFAVAVAVAVTLNLFTSIGHPPRRGLLTRLTILMYEFQRNNSPNDLYTIHMYGYV